MCYYFLVNALTVWRSATSLGAVIASTSGNLPYAAFLLTTGALSDMDGRVARRFHVETKAGAARDKLADLAWFQGFFAVLFKSLIDTQTVPIDRAVVGSLILVLMNLYAYYGFVKPELDSSNQV